MALLVGQERTVNLAMKPGDFTAGTFCNWCLILASVSEKFENGRENRDGIFPSPTGIFREVCNQDPLVNTTHGRLRLFWRFRLWCGRKEPR